MALDGDAIAIAMEAWSQLLHSTISNLPPSDMSREYYYTAPTKGFNRLQGTPSHLEIYRYKLGTDNIEARLRSRTHSQVVQGIDHIQDCIRSIKLPDWGQGDQEQSKQGIEHIQDCIRSIKRSEFVQGNQEQNKQGIEHIQDCIRSIKRSESVQGNQEQNKQGIEHIQYCMRSIERSESVQGNHEQDKQGIEHIQDCIRSIKRSELVQGNHEQNKQEIEHIQDCIIFTKVSELVQSYERIEESTRSSVLFKPAEHKEESTRSSVLFKPAEHKNHLSIKPESEDQLWTDYLQNQKMSTWFDELLELVKNVDLHGAEKLIMRHEVLQVIKLLHHYGIDTIRRGAEEVLLFQNQKFEFVLKDQALRCNIKSLKIKILKVMLQICDTKKCPRTIGEIIVKAENDQVVYIG